MHHCEVVHLCLERRKIVGRHQHTVVVGILREEGDELFPSDVVKIPQRFVKQQVIRAFRKRERHIEFPRESSGKVTCDAIQCGIKTETVDHHSDPFLAGTDKRSEDIQVLTGGKRLIKGGALEPCTDGALHLDLTPGRMREAQNTPE